MHVVTRKAIIAIALAGASIAGGLVFVGASAKLASADDAYTIIECNVSSNECKECKPDSNECGPPCADWGCGKVDPERDPYYPIIKCDTVSHKCFKCDGNQICTDCDQWGCGTNAAEIQNQPIGPLHLGGLPNKAGFRMDPVLYQGDKAYQLLVENGEIIGKDDDGTQIAGKQLEGSWFLLHGPDATAPKVARGIAPSPQQWKVSIKNVAVVPLFTSRSLSSGAKGNALTYEYAFAYALELPEIGGQAHVCPEVSAWNWEPYSGPRSAVNLGVSRGSFAVLPWQKPARYAILVKGETYDPDTAAVVKQGAAGKPWLNIACAGTALAKMKLMGYDPEETQYPTTPGQRQATLRMITARYCGGKSFTTAGQPLVWQNERKWFRTKQPGTRRYQIGDVEAVWNQDGAICLNTPRLTQSWTRQAVIDACGVEIPRCDDYFVPGQPLAGNAGAKKSLVPIDPANYVPPGNEWVTLPSLVKRRATK